VVAVLLAVDESLCQPGSGLAGAGWKIGVASRAVRAGDIVSTGTCTGHLFAASGDTVRADFGPLGVVEAHFA
jgi:2-keto-4-pentenoate hydratase